jgi:hypothetical protein
LDGELESAAAPVISAHVSGCDRCGSLVAELREVDVLLRRVPPVELARVDLSRAFEGRGWPLRVPTALVLATLAVTGVAFGGTVVGKQLAQVFRTDSHVETRPVERFPEEDFRIIQGGRAVNPDFQPGATPVPDIRPVSEVEASLETHLLEPAFVPEGYELLVRNSPLRLHAELLYLTHLVGGWTTIEIRESNYASSVDIRGRELKENPPVPPDAAETVYINGHRGIYIRGGWSQEDEASMPEWDADVAHSVIFDVGVLVVEISAPVTVSRDDLLRMAASLR